MIKLNDKRGASLSGWTEVGIGVIIIMTCLIIIIAGSNGMNKLYGKNNDGTFGITTNTTKYYLDQYQDSLEKGAKGEAESSEITGISVPKAWLIITAGLSIVWDMVSGAWITNSIGLLNLGGAGDVLAWGLRLLFVFSVGFTVIKILFKVKP